MQSLDMKSGSNEDQVVNPYRRRRCCKSEVRVLAESGAGRRSRGSVDCVRGAPTMTANSSIDCSAGRHAQAAFGECFFCLYSLRKQSLCLLEFSPSCNAQSPARSIDEISKHAHAGRGTFGRDFFRGQRACNCGSAFGEQPGARMGRIGFHIGYPLAFTLCRHISPPSLEVLHCTLVCLRCFPRTEGTQIAPFPSLGISFTRIQSILARFQLSNHWSLPPCLNCCDVRMYPAVVRHLHAKVMLATPRVATFWSAASGDQLR